MKDWLIDCWDIACDIYGPLLRLLFHPVVLLLGLSVAGAERLIELLDGESRS